jgi:hypothetical protein
MRFAGRVLDAAETPPAAVPAFGRLQPCLLGQDEDKRIACLTYHKYPGEAWPKEQFFPTEVRLASGERAVIQQGRLRLSDAERTRLGEIGVG